MDAKILNDLQNDQWAIEPSALESLIGAVTADMGDAVAGGRNATIKGNVGVIDINGPIMARDGFLAKLFGLNSVEQIAADLRALEADSAVTDILLYVDSPGGSVTGLSDLAEQIAASPKRVTAYVAGSMQSAAYWLGSAASAVVASDTALVGSIGVVASVTPWAEPGKVTVISTQSPRKNEDPASKSGLAALQKIVDEIAAVFIDTVARNRGVTAETVQRDYGEGASFIAKEALERGMIDGISSFSGLINSLKTAAGGKKEKGEKMDLKTLQNEHRDVFDAAVKMGIDAERKRTEAHLVMGEASGDMATAIEAIKKGDELDALYTARYQAASMKAAQMAARAADNPEGIEGTVGDGVPAGDQFDEAEAVADMVVDGLSFYMEGGA